jgi:hypothetical protein
MVAPSPPGTYHLPLWIQRIVLIVSVGLIAIKMVFPENVWGPMAVAAFTLTALFVLHTTN